MFNSIVINPAYAGSRGALSATALYRNQWTGMDGAPTTATFSLHSPLKNDNVALGLTIINDKISIFQTLNVNGIYSYSINLGKGSLNLGLQYGITNYKITPSTVRFDDESDVYATLGNVNKIYPNVGTGLFYHTEKFYAGLGVPRIVSFKMKSDDALISDIRLERHYFFNTGYVYSLNEQISLKPSVLLKAASGTPVQFDLNLNAFYKDFLGAGISYRNKEALCALLSVHYKKFRFGYAHDLGISGISKYGGGSHEIMLNFEHDFRINKIITPRFF
jgi:type IX secretion system PorP/SprF family membrane protein